jgi:hypothetical protein
MVSQFSTFALHWWGTSQLHLLHTYGGSYILPQRERNRKRSYGHPKDSNVLSQAAEVQTLSQPCLTGPRVDSDDLTPSIPTINLSKRDSNYPFNDQSIVSKIQNRGSLSRVLSADDIEHSPASTRIGKGCSQRLLHVIAVVQAIRPVQYCENST